MLTKSRRPESQYAPTPPFWPVAKYRKNANSRGLANNRALWQEWNTLSSRKNGPHLNALESVLARADEALFLISRMRLARSLAESSDEAERGGLLKKSPLLVYTWLVANSGQDTIRSSYRVTTTYGFLLARSRIGDLRTASFSWPMPTIVSTTSLCMRSIELIGVLASPPPAKRPKIKTVYRLKPSWMKGSESEFLSSRRKPATQHISTLAYNFQTFKQRICMFRTADPA